jgi:hypothetical protein
VSLIWLHRAKQITRYQWQKTISVFYNYVITPIKAEECDNVWSFTALVQRNSENFIWHHFRPACIWALYRNQLINRCIIWGRHWHYIVTAQYHLEHCIVTTTAICMIFLQITRHQQKDNSDENVICNIKKTNLCLHT